MKPEDNPVFLAAVDLVRRTGASSFGVRYQDDDDPVVWIAVAEYEGGWDAGAGRDPFQAVMRLLDQLIDGGCCTHCGRPTGVTPDFEGAMPLDKLVCWYRYDPELKTFRRGCE